MIIYTAADSDQLHRLMSEVGLKMYDIPEIQDGSHLPLSPLEIMTRVEGWALDGFSFATMSEIAILKVSEMVRHGRIRPYSILFRDLMGVDHRIGMDIKGEFVQGWPEDGLNSIFEAAFYLRFH